MTRSVRIAIGADHGGFETKQGLIPHIIGLGHSVQDVGTHSKDPVDYPRIASLVATAVSNKQADFGIIIDGAGIGPGAQLRREAIADLCAMHAKAPPEQLTPEIEQEIVRIVHEVRAERRQRNAN